MWVQFIGINQSEDFILCVCYLPPSNSSRGDNSVEFFDHLKANVYSYQSIGTFCICGDFNARCGHLQDSDNVNLCSRFITDHGPPNGHGKSLIDFLKCTDMCMLNGRSDQGNGYTSVSPKGLAVVDYCLVPIDSLTQVTNFKVLDILDVAEKFHIDIPTKIPDHSLLTWDLNVKTVMDIEIHTHTHHSKHFHKMPDNFLESDIAREKFEALNSKNGSFRQLDSIYSDFCDAVESDLIVKELSMSRKKHEPWWNSTLTELRKVGKPALNGSLINLIFS